MPAPAPDHTVQPRTATRSRWSAILLAVVLGMAAGILGTVLHLNLSWLGGVLLPWGCLLYTSPSPRD